MKMAFCTLPTVERTPLECDQQSSFKCELISFTQLSVYLNLLLFFGRDVNLAVEHNWFKEEVQTS